MRLINVEPLYKKTCKLEAEAQKHLNNCAERTSDWYHWNTILCERTAFKYDILDAPIKHGKWVKKTENLDGTATYKCSNCEYEETLEASPIHYGMNYCNYCGADMGLDDE